MSGENQKPSDTDKALEVAVASIEKEFGKGSILSGSSHFPDIERISSGSIRLDAALGGGYALGRFLEIYGPESSGKTTLALHAIAGCQSKGYKAAFIDAEHALDIKYAAALGVDVEHLLISQPDCGEQALNIVEHLVRSGVVRLQVVDSIAALVPRAELEGDMGDSHMGLQARMMSQAMRKLCAICERANTSVLFINQIRMKIGVMFGNPETTTGGNALKFYASQRLDIRRIGILKDGSGDEAEKIGISTRVKVVKNKVGPPFKECEFNIIFGEGIDWAAELLDIAVEKNIVEKSGAWYSYQGERIGQGAANAVTTIRERNALSIALRKAITGVDT